MRLVQDEKGGKNVKIWRAQQDCQGLEGLEGNGAVMSAIMIKDALKIHYKAVKCPEDYDMLASELMLDIEEDAEQIIREISPTGTR